MNSPNHKCPSDSEVLNLTIISESSTYRVRLLCTCLRVWKLAPPIYLYGLFETAFHDHRTLTHAEMVPATRGVFSLGIDNPPRDPVESIASIVGRQADMEIVRSRQGVISYRPRRMTSVRPYIAPLKT